MEVDIDLIRPSPYQPRLTFDVEDLKEEIRRYGLLSSLIVRKRDGSYEIIDGERRWRALKELGWKTVEVEIRDVDDRTARRSVFKLNKIRENYTTEEEARYYKRLEDEEKMTPWEISQELGVEFHWVLANLNIFKFPEDIQEEIFSVRGQLSVSHIKALENVIGRNISEATEYLRGAIKARVSARELEKVLAEREAKVEERRLEAVKEVLPEVIPEITKPKTPEEFEKAAKALRKEAKRKREEALTLEEKAAREAEKRRKLEEKRRREEERKRRVEEEARRRARELEEAERRRIEEEALRKAEEKLLKDKEHLKKAHEEWLKTELIPMREAKEELAVKEGIIYTIGELDCDRCGRHYVIKCDGKRNWLE